MQDSTVTLIIGIAGIIGTLVSSGVGFYFTAKARRSIYQETLFKEQIALLKEAHRLVGKSKNFVSIRISDDKEAHQFATKELGKLIPKLSQIADEGSAILPTEVWVDLNQYVSNLCEFQEKPENERLEYKNTVATSAVSFALATRKLIGVEELSMETYNLLSGAKAKELLDTDERSELNEMVRIRKDA